MKTFRINPFSVFGPPIFLTVGYVAIALYFRFVLKYDLFRSDVLWYWQDSLNWKTPFNRFHLPVYPLIIALLRSISVGHIPPIMLMMGINLAALIISSLSIYNSIKITGISDRFAAIGSCLFGLWPFVGLVYTVNPISDVPATAFLLTGLLAILHSHTFVAAVLLGISLVVHKAMWPFVILIVLAYICKCRPRTWKYIVALFILLAPICALWLMGSFYYSDPNWLLSTSASVGSSARAVLPILEGMIGTIVAGGLKGFVKGGLVVSIAVMATLSLFASYRSKPPQFQYGIAIAAACLFGFVVLTHIEIWAAVRFSRLLALPLIWNLGHLYREKRPAWLTDYISAIVLIFLFATQFASSWYMARVYFK